MAGSSIRVNSIVVRQQINYMQKILSRTQSTFPDIQNNSGETADMLKEAFKICKKLESDFRQLISDTISIMTSSLAAFEGADSSLAGMFRSSLPGIASAIGTVSVQNPHGRIGTAQSVFSSIEPQIGKIEQHQITPGTAVTPNWRNAVFSTTNGIGVTLSSIASAIGHVDVQVGELIDPHIHLSRDLLDFFETHTFDVESFIGDADTRLEPKPQQLWFGIFIGDQLPVFVYLQNELIGRVDTGAAQVGMAAAMQGSGQNTVSVSGGSWFENDVSGSSQTPGSIFSHLHQEKPDWFQHLWISWLWTHHHHRPDPDSVRQIDFPEGVTAESIRVQPDVSAYAGTASVTTEASSMTAALAAGQVICSPEYASGEIGAQPVPAVA